MDAAARLPIIGLMRRWVIDFFNSHDAAAARGLLSPDYALRVGEATIEGRDEYLAAVQRQFEQFPGLGMTVHAVVSTEDRIALHFTEHGASAGVDSAVTCWSGVALYRSDGAVLTGCVAVEDYAARRRQLKSGKPDAIRPPMAAPRDGAAQPTDPEVETLVRRWLIDQTAVSATGIVHDDEDAIVSEPLDFVATEVDITDIFSAGSRVAFHTRAVGNDSAGRSVVLCSAGIVTVANGCVTDGRVIRDRAALQRARHRTARA